jgi:HEAT repeat protein
LRRKEAAVVELFRNDLENSFVFMKFQDALWPEIVPALKENLEKMTPGARTNAEMLILLSAKDPVPALVALLDDPKWTDKNLALGELAQFGDPRAVGPVARNLREAPAGYFHTDERLVAGVGVENGLEAIANARTKEALDELIELLAVDLSRFGTYIDGDGFRRIVAGHLINLTGESFGVDAEAWRKWNRSANGHAGGWK